jgi:hypothetical protein
VGGIIMIVTIHQPEHLPWIGFFDKMNHADCFILLDNVDYRKRYFQNRNKILTKQGPVYLTVPISNNKVHKKIKDIQVSEAFSREEYLKTLQRAYARHPYFNDYFPEISKIILSNHTKLADLNIDLIHFFVKALGIKTKIYKASEMDVNGNSSELLLDICKQMNADTYLSGPLGRDYLDENLFLKNNISVTYHEFNHPIYPQQNSSTFISNLSTVDLLFNTGGQSSSYIMSKKL